MNDALIQALIAARAAEKDQALAYRALAAQAADADQDDATERLNGLHADEQHHLSRLTARLLELNVELEELGVRRAPPLELADWLTIAAEREAAEIDRYERLLELEMDTETRALIEEILESERQHASELGGKWMRA